MHGLTVTGTILLSVFFLFLIALLVELSYVLCLRRSRRRSLSVNEASPRPPLGKELLLFLLCYKNKSRIEPAANAAPVDHRPPEETAEEAEEDTAAKWQMGLLYGSYGPSRFLFTIKEEDREDGFSAEDISGDGENIRRHIPVEIGDSTPFSTPCASPPYYTPSPSPGREEIPQYVRD